MQKHKFQNKHIHRLCDYILEYSKIHVYNSTTIFIPVQKYKSQYKNKSCGKKEFQKCKEKYNNSTTMCIPVQKYKFQYKKKSFGTEKYFLKNLEKIGRYFIYDYYNVPKYMLIIVYLNKTYLLHYCKLSRIFESFRTGVYIFVLKLTCLYWDTYCCTGVYFIVLVNIRTANEYVCVLRCRMQ